MAQSLEKRMTDVEYITAHLPDDLNARFAGVDVKFAAIRETQLLHTQRFSTIERKLDLLSGRVDALEDRIDGLESRFERLESKMDRLEGQMDRLEGRMGQIDSRMEGFQSRVETRFDELDRKSDLILQRLPS